jgi:hypothetical protein
VNIITNVLFHFRPRRRLIESNGRATVVVDLTESDDGAVAEENIFRNQSIRKNDCLWWTCLLTDRDELSNLYRGHAIDASYQVSVHLTKRFQRTFLKIPLCQMNRNLVGNILGRSSIKIAHLVPIR